MPAGTCNAHRSDGTSRDLDRHLVRRVQRAARALKRTHRRRRLLGSRRNCKHKLPRTGRLPLATARVQTLCADMLMRAECVATRSLLCVLRSTGARGSEGPESSRAPCRPGCHCRTPAGPRGGRKFCSCVNLWRLLNASIAQNECCHLSCHRPCLAPRHQASRSPGRKQGRGSHPHQLTNSYVLMCPFGCLHFNPRLSTGIPVREWVASMRA